MSLSPNRDQEIMAFEEVQKELSKIMQCLSCDWSGELHEAIVWADVRDETLRCPDCQSAFVLSKSEGQEIVASHQEWDAARQQADLDGDSLEIDDDVQIPF
ncbi:hypothetical protein [Marinomonas fungiae]|uniref:hypothetical protein n=1 Tax=Marinomonas fungiae TaxID=1137284 RepID=UPI003A8D6FC4